MTDRKEEKRLILKVAFLIELFKLYHLYNLSLIALLTVDDFGSLWGVTRLKLFQTMV